MKLNARRQSQGFTLIELVVVLGIVAVLVAFTIVAVQESRGSSRKARCANNLRQLGLALGSYNASVQVFPPGVQGKGYSFQSALLAYLDQNPLHDSLNFDISPLFALRAGGVNLTAAAAVVDVFLCPADRGAVGLGTGPTNYAGNRGRGVQKYGYDGAFPFEIEGPIGYEGFQDGTSVTAAMAEWLMGPIGLLDRDARRSTFQTPRALLRSHELEQFAIECRGLVVENAEVSPLGKGRSWLLGDFSRTLYNHTMTPNERSCTNQTAVQQGAWTAGSLHRGGTSVLFVDGHTTFLSQSISLAAWRALGSRAGGEFGLDQSP